MARAPAHGGLPILSPTSVRGGAARSGPDDAAAREGPGSQGAARRDGLPAVARSGADGASDLPYRHLLQEIRAGRLAAGAHVNAEAVATELGLSRQPVRDAVRRLAAEGLIDLRPNRGAFVISRSVAEVTELFEIRALYEGLAARHVAGRIDRAGLQAATQALDALVTSRDDVDGFVAAHDSFHAVFHAYCPRPRLLAEIRRINHAIEPLLRLMLRHSPTAYSATVSEHRDLIAAIASADPDRAERATRAHVLGQDATELLPRADAPAPAAAGRGPPLPP